MSLATTLVGYCHSLMVTLDLFTGFPAGHLASLHIVLFMCLVEIGLL
jgi:hypothetical protein